MIGALNDALIRAFAAIFIMSIEATLVAVIVMLIKRAFSSKINVRVSYLLWGLVFIRLIFPALPQSSISILNYADFGLATRISAWKDAALNRSAGGVLPTEDPLDVGAHRDTSANSRSSAIADEQQSHTRESMEGGDVQAHAPYDRFRKSIISILSSKLSPRVTLLISSYLWAAGTILIAAYLLARNALFSRQLKNMSHISSPGLSKAVDRIKSITKVNRTVRFVEMEGIASPCVVGIINHTIILPEGLLGQMLAGDGGRDNMQAIGRAGGFRPKEGMAAQAGVERRLGLAERAQSDEKALFHILAHEFAHIKHNDLAVNWLASLACAVHWFNPVVWHCLKLLRREQELCADAYAMSLMDEEEFEQYGQTLLSVIKKSRKHLPSPVMAGIAEKKDALKQRIASIATFTKKKYRLTLTGILAVLAAAIFLCTSPMRYSGKKSIGFRPDDPSYLNIVYERGYKIVHQSQISHKVNFTPDMFPDEYVIAYQSDDIDWRIPLFTYENTTAYLKCIVESNESPDYLYAIFYFIHDVDGSPGNILSVSTVNFEDNASRSFTLTADVERDIFSPSLGTTIEDTVSLRGVGPGCQMAIYLKRSVVEQTGGQFTVTLKGLNLISYVPKSQYIPLDEQKKRRIRDMVYDRIVAGSKEKLTGEEEVYAMVGQKGQKVVDLESKTWVDVSGRYVYWVSFRTQLDGMLGPITALVDPETERIIGVFLRY